MKPETRWVLERYPESMWRPATKRRLVSLSQPDSLLGRFLGAVKGEVYAATVMPAVDLAAFQLLSPCRRTALLKKLVSDACGDTPILFANWEYRENGQPHFHALVSESGAQLLEASFEDVVLKPTHCKRKSIEGWLSYMLKPPYAASVKAGIHHLNRGDRQTGKKRLDAVHATWAAERVALQTQDGRLRRPNRLHAQGLPKPFRPLSDREWEKIAFLFVAQGKAGRPRKHERDILNAVAWRQHYGLPWRKLPAVYPPFQTCQRHFQEWHRQKLWAELLALLPPRMQKSFETREKAVKTTSACPL